VIPKPRYGGAVDVKRASDLYAQGVDLRQIGAQVGLAETTLSDQLPRAEIAMRRGAPPTHPASTQKVLKLRDQGLTWAEVATQVDMAVSGAWSRYRRPRPPNHQPLGRWQQVLAESLDQNLAIGVRAVIDDHLGRAPTRAELTPARGAAHSLAASVGPACCTCRARGRGRQYRRPHPFGADEAECDHERHPTPRAGGCRE
jgi:hypothetical protein